MSQEEPVEVHWKALEALLESRDVAQIHGFIRELPATEVAYTISHLEEEDQTLLFELLSPDIAADLIEHFADEQAADLIEDLDVERAAAIVDQMDSDDQADVLGEMETEDAEAILDEMRPEEALDVRDRLEYGSDTAGGIMITEYLHYEGTQPIQAVISDLRARQEEYANYVVQYVYVVDDDERLQGIVRLQDLVLGIGTEPLRAIMRQDPVSVPLEMSVSDLEDAFDHTDLHALPVVDGRGKLCGALRRAHVEEASHEKADRNLMRFGGIIRGDELRSMPLASRSLRRLAFLIPNIFLMLISISVIRAFEEAVLSRVITLAAFLPLIAGVSGCSGNQAVAVSIRELSLGLAKPADTWRVLRKELWLGLINGLVMGTILFGITLVWAHLGHWTSGIYMAAIVGGCVPLTVVFSVTLGGTVPLMLSKFDVDPAMASGPILTTLVDFFSFFSVLGVAWFLIEKLV